MKKLAVGVMAIVALIGTPVLAADLNKPVYNPPPAPALVPVYNWTGWYVGGNIGYGWGVNTGSGYTSFNDVDIGGVAGFFANGGNVLPGVKPSGVIGGGQIGYDWQFAPLWVLGFVADIQASDMRDSATAAAPNIGNFTSITESNSARVDWFGTVRAKAGFVANNNWLIYGTGGLAYGHVHANTAFNDPSFDASLVPVTFTGATSDTKTGWTAGAGIEYALSPNWTVGAEYLYVDLGTISVTETQATGAATLASTFTSGSKFRDNIARLIINYKFGGY